MKNFKILILAILLFSSCNNNLDERLKKQEQQVEKIIKTINVLAKNDSTFIYNFNQLQTQDSSIIELIDAHLEYNH